MPTLPGVARNGRLPASVVGHVGRSHGLQVLFRAACLALRSGVQPLPTTALQKFALLKIVLTRLRARFRSDCVRRCAVVHLLLGRY